jgi:hypothetical protein
MRRATRNLLQMFPLLEVIRKVMTGGGECGNIDWTLLGISMAGMGVDRGGNARARWHPQQRRLPGALAPLKRQKIRPPSHQASAAMPADAGMVTIHAITMLPATPQRTAEVPRVVPTPMMAPVMVWVVDTGMPK